MRLPLVLEVLLFPVPCAVCTYILIGVSTVGTVIRATHLTIESVLHFFSANRTCRHIFTDVKTTLCKQEIPLTVVKYVNYAGKINISLLIRFIFTEISEYPSTALKLLY